MITSPPRQLQTHHGTVIFLDDHAGELRHGARASSPSNVFLSVENDAGCLLYGSNQADRHGIRIVAGSARGLVRDARPPSEPLTIVPVDDGLIALRGEGLLLCAEPNGHVTLSRQEIGLWERFRPIESPPARSVARKISVAPTQPVRRPAMAEELVHVTVGYPTGPFMDLLGQSSEWHGCQFVPLPKYWPAGAFNMLNKEFLVKSYLESGAVDLGSIVLFTDAYDVLIVEHAGAITEKFRAFDADIVFGAESFFYPTTPDGREDVKARFDRYDSKWRYLNGGGYIGYAWAVRQMVDFVADLSARKDYDPSWESNDQPFQQEFFVRHQDSTECRVALDTGADIFACLNQSINDYVVDRSRVRHRLSGKTASILHANGGKDYLGAMERYWTLIGGPRGRSRPHDLRVASVGDHVLAYHPDSHKLVPSTAADPAAVVFLVKGARRVMALSGSHGFLTFNPHGGVEHGAPRINLWEILALRDTITTFHGTTLEPYCELPEGQQIVIGPPLLSFLSRPSHDDLYAEIEKWEDLL